MLPTIARSLWIVAIVAAANASAHATAQNPWDPQPERDLKLMLHIAWSRGPNLPQGFQDSNGGVIENTLISACGFCAGHDNDRKPGRYPRGFLKKVWAIDLHNEASGWKDLPEFPGAARQGLMAALVNGGLYYWGGFSYEKPFCYADGYRLLQRDGSWVWEPLPPLPWPLCAAGACAIGTNLYVFGGADYDADTFFTKTDRAGKCPRLGAQLLVFDARKVDIGWEPLPECPGTPRWVAAVAALGAKIYVIGGATGGPYATVVDNWCYDTETRKWSRVRDLPIASGNFPAGAIVFQNRYLLLGGGYQYDLVANPDGTTRKPYGTPHRFQDGGSYYNDMFVYDTKTDLFGRADSMPLNNNLSMMLVHGDEVFMLGGETGGAVVEGEFYGHHPDLFLKGKISAVEDRRPDQPSSNPAVP